MLATQRGVYFALIGKGLGIMEVEMERFDKNQGKFKKQLAIEDGSEHSMSMRNPEATEMGEITSGGARQTEIDGMS